MDREKIFDYPGLVKYEFISYNLKEVHIDENDT